jgi:hypothetical protein
VNPIFCVEDTFPGSRRYSVEGIANTGYVVIACFWRLDLMVVRSFGLDYVAGVLYYFLYRCLF